MVHAKMENANAWKVGRALNVIKKKIPVTKFNAKMGVDAKMENVDAWTVGRVLNVIKKKIPVRKLNAKMGAVVRENAIATKGGQVLDVIRK